MKLNLNVNYFKYKKNKLISYFLLLLSIFPIIFLPPTSAHAQTLNLGKVNFPNSGSVAAQESFLDGLAALHCFWYQKAFEKFREAERIDPSFALAYWGEAMTFNHPVWYEQDLESGRATLKRLGNSPAERIAKAKTKIEKAFISSLDLLYGNGTKEERDQKYKSALEDLYQKYPNDIEVTTFYALSILGTVRVYEGNYDKQLQAAHILENFLKKRGMDALNHPGLLHYIIHAYDHPNYASRGLKFARLYSKVSPDSSHALHMPSHIFLQLGMWDNVIRQNIASYDASVKWAKLDKKGYKGYDFHSLYWLLYAYLQRGKFKEAKAVLSTMKAIADADPSDRVQGYYGMMKARYAIESGQWDELGIPKSSQENKERLEANLHAGCVGSETEHNRVSSILALGIGSTKTGHLDGINSALEHMEHLKATYSGDNGAFDQKVLDIQIQSISGLSDLAHGHKNKGLELLRRAAEAEENLDPLSGPPIPAKPAIELYAENLLEQNQPQEALKWFKKSLLRTPFRTLSLLGAYRSSKRIKLEKDSKKYLNTLKQIYREADPEVKSLIE